MRFKTIVITRRTVIIAAVSAALIGGGVLTAHVAGKNISGMFRREGIYEDILSKGLPDSSERHFTLKDIVNKLTGFDADNPAAIIGKYSRIFKHDVATDNTEQPVREESGEDPSYEPPLPDNAQICAASELAMNNATDYDVDINALCAEELSFEITYDEPQALVIHTHTTECYDGDQMNGETERNTNEELNVIAVGDEICRALEENGIKTVHDKTYHDYPSYQGSYTRALTTIENQLAEYPSIKIVLDVHRDAFIYEDGSKLKVECEQNGISAAQVMLVVGSDSMGLEHPDWRENLKFAAKIQSSANIMYPGLMRPINLRTERFNEHTTNGSLILEVGSNGNTLSQAKEGGKYVARAIAAVLLAK